MALDNRWATPMPTPGGVSPWMPEAQPQPMGWGGGLPWMSPQFMRQPRPMPGLQAMGGGGGLPGPWGSMGRRLGGGFGGGGFSGGAEPGIPGVTAFDPNNPFAAPQFTRPLESYDQMASYLIRAFGQGGGFGAMGDPRITEMLRSRAFEDNAARQNAARLGARLQGGGDPYLQAFAALQSQMGGQSDLSRSLSGANLQQALSAQDWMRQLFSGAVGQDYNRDAYLAQIAAQDRASRRAAEAAGWGAAAGLGGAGLGAWRPPT